MPSIRVASAWEFDQERARNFLSVLAASARERQRNGALAQQSGFYRKFATGVACRQGTLTPPDTWFLPFGTCICSTR